MRLTLDDVVFDETMRDSERSRRVETQRFFDGRFEIWERGSVFERWQPLATHYGIELSLHAFLHVREEHHRKEECGDARCRLLEGKFPRFNTEKQPSE